MQEKLVIENQNLVHHVCRKYFSNQFFYHEYEDIAGVGMIGLVQAAKRFRPELGFQFSTFACRVIENEIRKYLRDTNAGGVIASGERKQEVACYSFQNILGDDMTYEDMLDTEQDFTAVEVDEFVSSLEGLEKEVCLLTLAGYKQWQIAKMLGISQGHVSRQLTRVRGKYARGMRSYAALSNV